MVYDPVSGKPHAKSVVVSKVQAAGLHLAVAVLMDGLNKHVSLVYVAHIWDDTAWE